MWTKYGRLTVYGSKLGQDSCYRVYFIKDPRFDHWGYQRDEVGTIRSTYDKKNDKWSSFWTDDGCDDPKEHLSTADKRFLLRSNLMACMCTAILILLAILISDRRVLQENDADTKEAIDMVRAYLASATDDGYAQIAQTIRHDLVLSGHNKDMIEYARYIPNSSGGRCICKKEYPTTQATLIFLNTGEAYPLDTGDVADPDTGQDSMQLAFGYDEISQTSICISESQGKENGSVGIDHGNSIVSIHRMKTLSCDNCIDAILDIIQDQPIQELVLYDTGGSTFYPVSDTATVQIGEYMLETRYQNMRYEMMVQYKEHPAE